jgi:hypothetical protein
MIYKFKSKASGDVVMLGADGDRLLRLLGREPAARGIFAAADLPRSIGTLQAAIAAEEAGRSEHPGPAAPTARPVMAPEGDGGAPAEPPVGLRRRLWPMIEMMRRCDAAGEPIVWGV